MTLPAPDNLLHLGLASALVQEIGNQVAPYASPLLTSPNLILETVVDNVTAHAGGTQAAALLLTAQTNRITVCATAGDSIALPKSVPGLEITVINHGAKPAQVYGQGTDTIDDVATATGVSQMQGSVVLYWCSSAGLWYSEGLATGYAGSFQTFSTTDGITAHAGGGQGAAVLLTAMQNRITTVGSAADSVVLPLSVAGMQVDVTNAAAVNSLNVFPAVGDAINALGANTAFALASPKTVTFICYTAGQWHTLPTVP